MKKIQIGLGLIATLLFSMQALAQASPQEEELPPLLETYPTRSYEILTPVGAGKKTISEAREQLRREAKKVEAEAVAGVRCEAGGVGRQGLTWYPKDAYCQGFAIRYRPTPSPPNGPARVKTWQKNWE
jgi:hypothetical protein